MGHPPILSPLQQTIRIIRHWESRQFLESHKYLITIHETLPRYLGEWHLLQCLLARCYLWRFRLFHRGGHPQQRRKSCLRCTECIRLAPATPCGISVCGQQLGTSGISTSSAAVSCTNFSVCFHRRRCSYWSKHIRKGAVIEESPCRRCIQQWHRTWKFRTLTQ